MIQRCDILIIGAGPAGLTSGIFSARSRFQTIIIDTNLTGGQVATTYHIANYPGTKGEIQGVELMENMKTQALSFGAQILETQKIKVLELLGPEKIIKTEEHEIKARAVIIATGAEPRKLPIDEESRFRGRGLHYCATCDGAMYPDANLAVIGGGISALEEALFLTRFAKTVQIINRSDHFKAAQPLVEEILKHPAVSVVYNSTVIKAFGEDFLQGILIEDKLTKGQRNLKVEGVFVYIGMEPSTQMFKDWIHLSDRGFILTDDKLATNVPGVFAAGDVRDKEIRQITTAVSDGTIAAINAENYIQNNLK